MSNGTITVEAKKYAMRQSKDGVILSLVIHPNDATSELLSAPIGQLWIVALAPYIESPSDESEGKAPVVDKHGRSLEGSERPATGAAKDRYRERPSAEQAVTRAVLLCKDPAFQSWAADQFCRAVSETDASDSIRAACCEGGSRSLIAVEPKFLQRFLALEHEYRQSVGLSAEARG